VLLEAVKMLLEAVKMPLEALRVRIEYIRIFLEAMSAFNPVWTKPLSFFFNLAWSRTNLFALL
jgi:hypothetical protein